MSEHIAREVQHNLKMFNDIARNLSPGRNEQQAAEMVAAHVKRFWSPMMIESLVEARESIDSELLDVAKIALPMLAE
ncbi:MAG: formate dehydrogenase subunit delta [Pseudomonadales bacterium]